MISYSWPHIMPRDPHPLSARFLKNSAFLKSVLNPQEKKLVVQRGVFPLLRREEKEIDALIGESPRYLPIVDLSGRWISVDPLGWFRSDVAQSAQRHWWSSWGSQDPILGHHCALLRAAGVILGNHIGSLVKRYSRYGPLFSYIVCILFTSQDTE